MKRIALVGLTLAVAAGCATTSAPTVRCEFRASTDFSEMKTYSWAPNQAPPTVDPRINTKTFQRRVHRTVDRELEAKGYKKVDAAQADFWMAYHALIKDREGSSAMYRDNLFGVDWTWEEAVEAKGRNYKTGSLLLGVVHPKRKKLLWHGWAEAELRVKATEEEREARIGWAIAEILAYFPPPSADEAGYQTPPPGERVLLERQAPLPK